VDESLRAGLVFMSVHYAESADVNQLTIEAWDPKSGTAEFKATAVRLEKVERELAEVMGGERVGV
jgi:predicted molibdopterin-dependent oxidoreductase YjgC